MKIHKSVGFFPALNTSVPAQRIIPSTEEKTEKTPRPALLSVRHIDGRFPNFMAILKKRHTVTVRRLFLFGHSWGLRRLLWYAKKAKYNLTGTWDVIFFSTSKHSRAWRLCGLFLAVCLLLPVCPVLCADSGRFVLSDFSLRFTEEHVQLALGIDVTDRESLRIMLKDGAQMELAGQIKVVRPRSLLPNITIAERPFSFLLNHDTLTREFELHVRPSPPADSAATLADAPSAAPPHPAASPDSTNTGSAGAGNTSSAAPESAAAIIVRDKELDRLLDETIKRLVTQVAPLSIFENGQDYRLILTLSLRHTDVPPWLAHTLLFWSWDVVPEASYELDFTYGGEHAHD